MIELQGTEAQVKYAEDLRTAFSRRIDAAILAGVKLQATKKMGSGDLQLLIDLQVQSLDAALQTAGIRKALSSEQCMTILKSAKKWAEQQKQAKWWIENGAFSIEYIVTAFCKKYVKTNA